MEPDFTGKSVALGRMAVRYRFRSRVMYHLSSRSSASIERYSRFVAGARGVGLLEGNMENAGLAHEEDDEWITSRLSSHAIVTFRLADHTSRPVRTRESYLEALSWINKIQNEPFLSFQIVCLALCSTNANRYIQSYICPGSIHIKAFNCTESICFPPRMTPPPVLL